MNIWKRFLLPRGGLNSKPTSRIWLPFFLFTILALILAACGSAEPPGASSPTPTTQATSSSSTNQDTPSPTTGTSKPAAALTGLRMLDANNGWALSATSILKTTDGGMHWKDVTPANAGLNQFARGNFLDQQSAWIAIPPTQQREGPGIDILHTANGGQSWQKAHIDDPLVATIDVPHFLGTQQGWLEASSTPGAGHAGSDIWYTTDGGQSWTKIASNMGNNGLTLGYVTGISFQDTQNGIAAGNLGAGGDNTVPAVSITHDGGHTWHMQALPHLLGGYEGIYNTSQPPVFFGSTAILPVNVTTSSGDLLVLYRSNTSGRTWTQTSVAHIRSDNTYVLDSAHAWATDTQSGQLYGTTDGGDHWSALSTKAYHLKALSFVNVNNGWGIAGESLLHTTDGGKTWQSLT
ncbi:hypothetical protein EPA93_46245 [Ktedonosporobacter rubrisoli]|uniref:Uncharacterized protein n=1 Tax=Ktedonosporobacter rubrisoli TaxID=2509675 RepID=A0A4P6K4J4_KTERU|nr:YCF48-related protein [Ktedonosporobacter rubrisoli]QBD82975.1 hypothetical protein EPA93_46245 [Ktedonosporobacter rubrisoli]